MITQFLNELPPTLFSDIKQIGSGAYSTIFSATHIPTNTKVALKTSPKVVDENKKKITDREFSILKSLNHPFICKFFEHFETDHLSIAVLELIEGKTLLNIVNENKGLGISEAQNIFSQLLIAVEYLHEHGISHRDLKLENIMVDDYGHIRLIDFGLSTTSSIMSTMCGSIPYCPPELLMRQTYTKEADIWGMGIILYAIVFGRLPFFSSNVKMLVNYICDKEIIFPKTADPSMCDLITKLLIKDPLKRITLEEIKTHDFISHVRLLQIDYKKLFSPPQSPQTNRRRRRRTEGLIRVSLSNPNLSLDLNSSNPELDLVLEKRSNSLRSNSDLTGSSQFSELHRIVNTSVENVDDLIISRKDFALNLNKLIEFALISDTPLSSRGSISPSPSQIKLRTCVPVRLRISGNLPTHRFSSSKIISSPSPIIAKPFM